MPPKKRIPPPQPDGKRIKRFFTGPASTNSRPASPQTGQQDDEVDGMPDAVTHTAADKLPVQTTTSGNRKTLTFQSDWINKFGDWLKYDSTINKMYCSLCRKESLTNSMSAGTDNFKTTTVTRHISSSDHQKALALPLARENFRRTVEGAKTKEEESIMACMNVVYWMAKEAIPLSKYHSLLNLLSDLDTPTLESLKQNRHVTYASCKSACGFLDAISTTIDHSVTEKIQESPVLTVLTDESTDIAVHHKLCVTARVLDPVTMHPNTLYLTDLHITSATGSGIFQAIKNHLSEERIPVDRVSAGLGTDGASVMTGRKTGLTGQFLRQNPHLINTHCAAHRVSLCSEQAAENIPAMKYYQSVLESEYDYFKTSPKRNDSLTEVQKLLDEPTLKCREVHQVRWLSFYQALEAIFRTLDSLLTLFKTNSASDPKAKGLSKKLGEDFFIKMTYALIQILKPIMRMSLFFQRKDIDIGSVQTVVDACVNELQELLENTEHRQLNADLQHDIFKGNHVITKSSYQFDKARREFIQALRDNVEKRFPEKQLMTSMCVFGLRPIHMLSDEELRVWGDESMDYLLDHFARPQTHAYTDPISLEKMTATSEAVVDRPEALQEWLMLKRTVKAQGYPVNSTAALWSLISLIKKWMGANGLP